MLHLLNEQHIRVGFFQNYDELVEFIHHSQIYKITHANILDHPLAQTLDLKDIGWRFVLYKHSELNIIYSCMKKPPITGLEKEAFDQGLDLIEIHHGSPLYPTQLPVTDDLDIELLKREWCEAYCEAHGFKLIEALRDEHLSDPLVEGGSNDLAV